MKKKESNLALRSSASRTPASILAIHTVSNRSTSVELRQFGQSEIRYSSAMRKPPRRRVAAGVQTDSFGENPGGQSKIPRPKRQLRAATGVLQQIDAGC